MTWYEAVLLGVLQGLSEFFPISSSGHLVLGQAILGLDVPGITFDVTVHVATLVSVSVVYREKLASLFAGIFQRGDKSTWPYILKLGIATVPAAIVGFTFREAFEARFEEPVFTATMLLVTGTLVWSSRWALGIRRIGIRELAPLIIAAGVSVYAGTFVPFLAVLAIEGGVMAIGRIAARDRSIQGEPTWDGAVLMGVAQAVAIFPGISRSGSTVLTGLWRRIDPVAAAEFSFLMSIPAILGAAVLQVPDALETGLMLSPAALAGGFIAAAISGMLAIRFFVALLRRRNFHVFAWYCWIVASLYLITT